MSRDRPLLLAIQTAVEPAEIALLIGDEAIAARAIADRLAVCRELALNIDLLLKSRGNAIADLEAIGICTGPGSFTGLRIGVAAAKALAHALERPLVGVNSLEALAFGFQPEYDLIMPVFAAGKERFFAACYRRNMNISRPPALLEKDDLTEWLREMGVSREEDGTPAKAIICGTIDRQIAELAEALDIETEELKPKALMVGRVAFNKFVQRSYVSSLALQPLYLRASSPEERAQSLISGTN